MKVRKHITWVTDSRGVIKETVCRICGHVHTCPNAKNHEESITKYYRVQIPHIDGKKKKASKSFNPKKYNGSRKKALAAAIKWRNATLKAAGQLHRLDPEEK